MKILVCGSRKWKHEDRHKIYKILDDIAWEFGCYTTEDGTDNRDQNWLPDFTIISGAAPGADQIAIDYAVVSWCQLEEYPADWKRWGQAAGPIRNKQMLIEGKPDLVVAFPIGESRGTRNMIWQAKKAGIPVRVIETA